MSDSDHSELKRRGSLLEIIKNANLPFFATSHVVEGSLDAKKFKENDKGEEESSLEDILPSEEESSSEEELPAEELLLLTVFQRQNCTFKIGGRRLHLNKEDLASASPVFKTMLNSDFKEAKATEIRLPGKKVRHMVRFFRYILPGFKDELKEETVHDMLPLAEEYQTDALKEQIDRFLANRVQEKGDTINSNQIVNNIKEAEKFNLPNYLKQCISVAARKLSQNLTKCAEYMDITTETRWKIYSMRSSEVDSCLKELNLYIRDSYYFDVSISKPVAEKLKTMIQNN